MFNHFKKKGATTYILLLEKIIENNVFRRIGKIFNDFFYSLFSFLFRFFVFGGQTKKKITSTSITSSNLQHGNASTSNRRRGSDRSLSGSAHELAVSGFRDITTIPLVPHSHSQSNLTNIPSRYDINNKTHLSS